MDSRRRASLHGHVIIEVPLHDQLPVPVDVDMSWTVISLPGHEDKASPPDPPHAEALPSRVPDGKGVGYRLSSSSTVRTSFRTSSGWRNPVLYTFRTRCWRSTRNTLST